METSSEDLKQVSTEITHGTSELPGLGKEWRECVERWRVLMEKNLECFKMVRKSEPIRSEAEILKAQQQVYSCLRKKIPHPPSNILQPNMIFGSKYIRDHEQTTQPVYTTVVRSEIGNIPSTTYLHDLSDQFTDPIPEGGVSPVYMLIQQRGAGKTFQMYGLAKTNFIFYLDMLTGIRDGLEFMDHPCGAQNFSVGSYYIAAKKILRSTSNTEIQYAKTVALTTHFVFANLIHLYVWKMCTGDTTGYQNWFQYSLSDTGLLMKIFEDLQSYSTNSVAEVICSLKELDDRRRYVFCFDEAIDLTTRKPTTGMLFTKGKIRYPLLHPFMDALISLNRFGIYRLVAGTMLSLCVVSPDSSPTLIFEGISLMFLKSLSDTTLTEIKQQILSYFPDLILNDQKLKRFVGRSRYLYDMLLPALFDQSKRLGGPEASKQKLLQKKFDEVVEDRLLHCILLYELYVKCYIETETERYVSIQQAPEEDEDRILHDIVLGNPEFRSIYFGKCNALLDYGLMFCIRVRNNQIELGCRDYIVNQGIIGYYQERASKRKHGEIRYRTPLGDEVLDGLIVNLKNNCVGSNADHLFKVSMMRYFQLEGHRRYSFFDVEYLRLFADPTLQFYQMEAYHFMGSGIQQKFENEGNGRRHNDYQITFSEYLARIEEFTDMGYFPPNNAGPDGVIPIVRRSFEEVSEIIGESEYEKLPRIRLVCFKFEFLRSVDSLGDVQNSISEEEIKRMIEMTNLDSLYILDQKQAEKCRRIFSTVEHPLYQASRHSLRYVVTAGKIMNSAEKLFEGISTPVLIRADQNLIIHPGVRVNLNRICSMKMQSED